MSSALDIKVKIMGFGVNNGYYVPSKLRLGEVGVKDRFYCRNWLKIFNHDYHIGPDMFCSDSHSYGPCDGDNIMSHAFKCHSYDHYLAV